MTEQPATAASAGEAAKPRMVDAYMLGSLFSRVKPLLIANIGSAVFLTVMLWNEANHLWLLVWTAGLTAWTMMRFVLAKAYLSKPRSADDTGRWAAYFAAGSGVGGMIWGLSVIFFAGYSAEEAKLPLALIAAALSAAALAGYAKSMIAFTAFLLPSLLPYGVHLVFLGGAFDPWVAGFFGLWLALVLLMARNLNQGFREVVALDVHNEGLVSELTVARDRAEAANVAKTRFLANLSHEFRTPLTAILGYSEMMVQKVMGPMGNDAYEPYAAHIHDSGAHLLKVIDEILDITKLEADAVALEESEVDVVAELAAAADVVSGTAAEDGIEVRSDVGDDLPKVLADGTKLRQIAINLLSNAVKFTPEGGAIDVRALRRPDGGVTFSVSDNGIGMSPQQIERATIPFAHLQDREHLERVRALKRDRGQTSNGLGLPLVKLLTERHGGDFVLESELNVGTTARVHLPAARSRPAEPRHRRSFDAGAAPAVQDDPSPAMAGKSLTALS